MKKTTISIVIVLISTALCGCGNNTQPTPDTNATATTSTDPSMENEIDVSIFPEVEATYENLEIYREEVSSRVESLGEDDTFITDEEWNIISSEWDDSDEILYRHNAYFTAFDEDYEEVYEYYYPVVYRTSNSLVLWYTNEYGSVELEPLFGDWNDSDYLGKLHSDSDEWISYEIDHLLTYTKESGQVKLWQFGETIDTFDVPANSVYCGFSHFEGYIFRSGTDVYALSYGAIHQDDEDVVCIAHNVEYVIDADYRAASDPWSQPLFLMKDGSIKCYISWEGDKDAAPDDASHLVAPYYEGGNGV